MTILNTQFSIKGISLLNSVMASSSSVQFKKFLFNQVDDIAGNEGGLNYYVLTFKINNLIQCTYCVHTFLHCTYINNNKKPACYICN